MSFSVELGSRVRERIGRLGLSSPAIRDLLDGFDRLAAAPHRHLLRVGPPVDALQFDLVVPDPGPPPRLFLFAFSVRYAADEESLLVVDCEYLVEDSAAP